MGDSVKSGYITMSKGNHKLDKSILIWSLPAGKSCPNCASCINHCYARRDERVYPDVLPCRMRNWLGAVQKDFVPRMIALIKRTQRNARKHVPTAVRIHESGDFYNKEYAEAWTEIARRCPELTFFGYTKVPWNLPHDITENMNIVESIMPDGSINFGSREKVIRMSKEFGAAICPYGKAKKEFKCGRECKACMNRRRVVFVQH